MLAHACYFLGTLNYRVGTNEIKSTSSSNDMYPESWTHVMN